MLVLSVLTLVLVAYLALQFRAITTAQTATLTVLQTAINELTTRVAEIAERTAPEPLAHGWFDEGWTVMQTERERESTPFDNPRSDAGENPLTYRFWALEYHALREPTDRVTFLRKLRRSGNWIPRELLDIVFADDSAYVRAWAAGHLRPNDHEEALFADPDITVRAAVWSNPECQRLPWRFLTLKDTWKVEFQQMTYLERLGLMRNPKLWRDYVLALLCTPTEELGITRDEHAKIMIAAATNPDLVGSGRWHGRAPFKGFDWSEPFKQYGHMWDTCLTHWADQPRVAYFFFRYIQTVPEKKLAVYRALLEQNDKNFLGCREAILSSCEPILDRELLKLAWDDPHVHCRRAAKERVGKFTQYVGVTPRPEDD